MRAARAFDAAAPTAMPPCLAGARIRGSPTRRCAPCRLVTRRAVDRAEHRGQIAARPERFLEAIGIDARARSSARLRKMIGPRNERRQQQQAHDELHDELAFSTSSRGFRSCGHHSTILLHESASQLLRQRPRAAGLRIQARDAHAARRAAVRHRCVRDRSAARTVRLARADLATRTVTCSSSP